MGKCKGGQKRPKANEHKKNLEPALSDHSLVGELPGKREASEVRTVLYYTVAICLLDYTVVAVSKY